MNPKLKIGPSPLSQLSINVDENYLPSDDQMHDYTINLDYSRPTDAQAYHIKNQRDRLQHLQNESDLLSRWKSSLQSQNIHLTQLQNMTKLEVKDTIEDMDSLLMHKHKTRGKTIENGGLHNAFSSIVQSPGYYTRSQSDGVTNRTTRCQEENLTQVPQSAKDLSFVSRFDPRSSSYIRSSSDIDCHISKNPSAMWECRRCTEKNLMIIETCLCGSGRPR